MQKNFSDGLHTFGCLWTADGCKFTVVGAVHYEYSYDLSSEYHNADIDAFHYQVDGLDIFYNPREAVEIDRPDLAER